MDEKLFRPAKKAFRARVKAALKANKMAPVRPTRAERVRFLLEDGWKDWKEFEAVLSSLSAEELHEFADRMNWDGGGTDRLMQVLKHPKCDRGTALMIYWRAEPIFGLKYGTRANLKAKAPHAIEAWDMRRYIEKRLKLPDEFVTSRIPYDPANDRGRDQTKQRRQNRPLIILGKRNGKWVKVGEKRQPDDPEIDVRAKLPPIVFEPVVAGSNRKRAR